MALAQRLAGRRWVSAAAAAALISATIAVSPAASAAPDSDDYHPAVPGSTKTGFAAVDARTKVSAPVQEADPNAPQRVFIQFAGTAAGSVFKSTIGKGKSAAKSAAAAKKSAITGTADAVSNALKAKDRGAKELYRTSNVLPGMAVSAKAGALRAIAARSDVVKVSKIVPKKLNNSGAAAFTKVLNTWQNLGLLGDGVSVGIIDTGIDYTHADFGGPGTVEAFDTATAAVDEFTPTDKVVGGYDFVGDAYDANDPTLVPEPDVNPIDCHGHGTHVGGTVAGLGENADGTTFTGDYTALTAEDLDAMKIGPGMAPAADLYALKVFGCDGSTDVVIDALDWALDPNDDGDFSDKLDIVNLSLGSDYGTEDDPENEFVNALAELGVLPVIAMGNANDVTDAGGSPGNAVRSLAVASTLDPFQLMDGLNVDAPADVAGVAPGQNSVLYDWSADPVSGSVAAIPGDNADGCSPLSAADAAKVVGKVAWLEWDDNDSTRRCGSVGRSDNVTDAGAIGAIFTSQLNAFNAGISGSDIAPVFQLTADQTEKLRPALDAGTLEVTFDGSLAASIHSTSPDIGDTISSFSSRGTHNAIGPVKPDVAAPGSTIASANVGTGDGVYSNSGTSMATPHVAGITALLKQQHPDWTTEQLKAAVMNTAGHDVYTEVGQQGDIYGPARVGAGRVDALDAVQTSLLAYSKDRPGAVSASFGVVWVPATTPSMTKKQVVTLQNTARTGTKVKVSYDPVVETPGVEYTVLPTTVYVPPRGVATVTVTMTITTADLEHTIDPTMDLVTQNPYTGLEEPRQYVTDASGRLLLKQVNQPDLRVPVYGVVKPTSTTKASKGMLGSQPAILFDGKGMAGDITSLASVMQLGAASDKLPTCTAEITEGCVSSGSERAGDIEYVGVGATRGPGNLASEGFLWFGISTYQNWATIGHSIIPYVDIDVDGDGEYDYEVFAQSVPDGTGQGTDLISAFVTDLNTGFLQSIAPINFNYGDVETNVFDGNTILLPVDPKAIGIDSSTRTFVINYRAATFSAFTGADIDAVEDIPAFNVISPRVKVAAPIYIDEDNAAVPYTLSKHATTSDKALVFHQHGTPNKRAETVAVK